MFRILLLLFLLLHTTLFSQNEKDSLERVLAKTAQDTNRVQLLIRISRFYDANDQKKATILLNEALSLSKKLKFEAGEANALVKLAVVSMEVNAYDYSDSCLQEALKIATRMKDTLFLGIIHNNFGMVHFEKFDYPRSLEHYFTAVKYLEGIHNESKLTSALNNIANIYFTQKLYDKALEYHLRSLEISKRLGAKSSIASSLNNLGLVYREKKDYKKAIEAYEEALKIAIEVNHKVGQSLLWNNLGKCRRIIGQYDEALKCFNEALKLKIEIGDANGAAHSYNNIGDVYYDLKQYNRSIEYNMLSIAESKKNNNAGTLVNAYQSLSMAYRELKDYKNAYMYHEMFFTIKDSLLNIEKMEQMAEMSTRFETEKKDKELIKKDAEIQFSEVESKRRATQRNAFLVGFVLIALLALVILKNLRDKQKANAKLTDAYGVIELKNRIVEEKNKNITDSINYAKRIQSALLASGSLLQRNLPEYFVLYLPKDIVSGDFYWAHQSDDSFLICTGDCTGHGVPGAFMSLLSISSLNEIVIEKKINAPNLVLDQLRDKIIKVMNPEGSLQKSYEGMDGTLCRYNFKSNELSFSGANNGVWIVSDGELREYKGDKQPIGFHVDAKPFALQQVKLKKSDIVYTYTDGYADQFGGEKGKKFKYKQLQSLLLSVSSQPMQDQKKLLEKALLDWKGGFEQVDDILLIGVKI